MGYVVAAVLGYLLGSIPVALLVARRHGVDLRRTGDGNPGAWNALEQLGARRAAPAFLGDARRACSPGWPGWRSRAGGARSRAWRGRWRGMRSRSSRGFRGGKSVMTFVGGAFALSPLAALVCLGACIASLLVASFAWGARVGVFAFPVVALAFSPVWQVAAIGGLMSFIGVLFFLRR